MLIKSDNVRRLLSFVFLFIPSLCYGQAMSVRFDAEAYDEARVNPDVVYFRIIYDSPTVNPTSSSQVVDLSYVFGRPETATSLSRFGFFDPRITQTRYVLIDGANLLVASQSGIQGYFLPVINENLARFGLGTSQERLRAIDVARGIVSMPEIVDSSNVQSTLGSIIVSWIKIALSIGVSLYALWTAYDVFKVFIGSRSIDSSEDWRDYAGDEADLYSSEQEWIDSVMARNRLENEWYENRQAARARGEKLVVPKVYLGTDSDGNDVYID